MYTRAEEAIYSIVDLRPETHCLEDGGDSVARCLEHQGR